VLGLILLLFSQWFASWRGLLWFCGISAFTAIALYVGNRHGRIAAIFVVVAVFGFIVWRAAAAPNPSIERTSSSGLRPLPAAAHVKR
jgi:hypothetical protein